MKRLWAALLLIALPAYAGNGISGITVSKTRGLTSAAIQAIVSGDDDSSAVLRLFVQYNDGSGLDSGMAMVRRTGSTIYEGRILWMTPGRTMRYFIEGTDASGNYNTPMDTVSCSVVRGIVATGPVYYVNQATGNDAGNDGLSPGAPEKTIGAAITDLTNSTNGGANGGIIIAPGEYHERIDLNFGTDGAQRFIIGDGTNVDSTIICGAKDDIENGFTGNGTTVLSWAAVGSDSVYKALCTSCDSTQLVVLGWGELLHRKASWKGISADTIQHANCSSATVGAERSGWFWHSDTLYVKRRNGQSPTGLKLHVGYRDKLIDVERRNWHISGLTFRFAGSLTDQTGLNQDAWINRANPAVNGNGIIASGCASTHSVSGLVVDSCKFIGLNAPGVLTNNSCIRSDSVTIAHCYFDGLSIGGFDYSAGKCGIEESATQPNLVNPSSAFYQNTVTGCFNGIGIGTAASDSTGGWRTEVCGNYFSNFPDDGIELDSSHQINMLVQGNTLRNTGSGISISPCYTGPIWILYNNILNASARGIKGGGAGTALVKAYHNTIVSNAMGSGGSPGFDDSPGTGSTGLEFRNNVLVSKKGAGVIYGPSSGGSTTANTFNYDLLDSVQTTRLVNWNGTGYSLASLRTSLTWEMNGVLGTFAPEDSTGLFNGGHWNPKLRSNALQNGMRIPGVNTGPGAPKFNGKPRIGSQGLLFGSEP